MTEFSFCESTAASGRSPWHLRELRGPLKLGGGIDTPSLCGTVRPGHGWDLESRVVDCVEADHVCVRCKARYDDFIKHGSFYAEHAGKKYVRMQDIAWLVKLLTEGNARTEWQIIQHPRFNRPFYLLEFALERRSLVTKRWNREIENFALQVPMEAITPAIHQLLCCSRKPAASSKPGTSSVPKASAWDERTTKGSRP